MCLLRPGVAYCERDCALNLPRAKTRLTRELTGTTDPLAASLCAHARMLEEVWEFDDPGLDTPGPDSVPGAWRRCTQLQRAAATAPLRDGGRHRWDEAPQGCSPTWAGGLPSFRSARHARATRTAALSGQSVQRWPRTRPTTALTRDSDGEVRSSIYLGVNWHGELEFDVRSTLALCHHLHPEG
jgi:hypothetical protein